MDEWTREDTEHMLINPFYAINIAPDLVGEHEPQVSKDAWVAANKKLIKEIGTQAWLEKLLAVLQGDYPRNPDDDLTLGHAHR
jgi:hypothetical protein